jgi:hypothetical protein
MAKHIGIIAVSFDGAALCYRTICQEAIAIMGDLAHPEVSMHNHSLSRYMDCIEKNDWDGVANLMVSSARKLAAAGADRSIEQIAMGQGSMIFAPANVARGIKSTQRLTILGIQQPH